MPYIPSNYEQQKERRDAAHKADMARRRHEIAELSAQVAANDKARREREAEEARLERLDDIRIDKELDREKQRRAARTPQREEMEAKALRLLDDDVPRTFMNQVDEFDRSSETLRSHWGANNGIVPSIGRSLYKEACARGKVAIVKYLLETYRGDDGARWLGSIYEALPTAQPALLHEISTGELLCDLFVWTKEKRPIKPDYCDMVPASVDIAQTTELICSSNPKCLRGTDSFGWGSNPIHCAVEYGHLEAVPVIMKHGGNEMANLQSRGGTPLHYAARKGRSKALPLLVKYGADVNATNSNKETPLHVAATAGEEECVKFLLRLGANPKLKDSYGRTALKSSSNHGVKQQLRTAGCDCSIQ